MRSKAKEYVVAIEITDNGARKLKPVARVVRDVVVFEEPVAKGTMARLVPVQSAKLETDHEG
jgi:hypothetical protein